MKSMRLRAAWGSLVLLVVTGGSPGRVAGAATSKDAASSQGEALAASLAKAGRWKVTASALLVGGTAVFPEKDTAHATVTFPTEKQLEAKFEDDKVVKVTFTRMPGSCSLVVVTAEDEKKLQDALKANPLNDLLQAMFALPLTGPEPVRQAATKALEAEPPPPGGPEQEPPEMLKSLIRTYDRCYEVAKPEHMPAAMEADTKTKVSFVLVVLSATEMRSSTVALIGTAGGMVQWHSWTWVGD